MKRKILIVVFISLMLLTLVSCTKGKTQFNLSEFSCDVSFTGNETVFSGKLEYISGNNISLTLNSPDRIKGIKLVYDGNSTDLISEDLTVPIEKLSSGMDVYTPLFVALRVLSMSEVEINKEGTDKVIIGDKADICITISCNDTKIISVENGGNIYNFSV